MRFSVLRLIAMRELRDLLRDRRSVLLILLMPLILYPFFGLAGIVLAKTTAEQKTVVGLVGGEYLPESPALLDGDGFAGQPKLLSCISASVPKGLDVFEMTQGPRVIFSTPPEINKSPSPALMPRLA